MTFQNAASITARPMLLRLCAVSLLAILTPVSSRAQWSVTATIKIGGLCVDTDGKYTFLAACNAKPSQVWVTRKAPAKEKYKTVVLGVEVPDGNNSVLIANVKYDKCLDAWGARLKSGDVVGLYDCLVPNQHNQLWESRDGLLYVGYWGKTVVKCLAVPNANFKSGQRLIIWDCADKNRAAAKDLRRRSQTFATGLFTEL